MCESINYFLYFPAFHLKTWLFLFLWLKEKKWKLHYINPKGKFIIHDYLCLRSVHLPDGGLRIEFLHEWYFVVHDLDKNRISLFLIIHSFIRSTIWGIEGLENHLLWFQNGWLCSSISEERWCDGKERKSWLYVFWS